MKAFLVHDFNFFFYNPFPLSFCDSFDKQEIRWELIFGQSFSDIFSPPYVQCIKSMEHFRGPVGGLAIKNSVQVDKML